MEEEVESLVPPSNNYPYQLYGERVDEMEENAKTQDGGNKTLSILVSILNKLRVLLHLSTCTSCR